MTQSDIPPPLDRGPTETNLELVASLTEVQVDQINSALVAATDAQWRKVALVVARAMLSLPNEFSAVPDVFFARQIRVLVSLGQLEGIGNLGDMRSSEVRRSAKGSQ